MLYSQCHTYTRSLNKPIYAPCYNVQMVLDFSYTCIGAASVQSLAGQPAIPASLLSNAINMAVSLSTSSTTNSIPGRPNNNFTYFNEKHKSDKPSEQCIARYNVCKHKLT